MQYTLTTIGGAFQKGRAFGMMRLAHKSIQTGRFHIVQARQHNDHLGTMCAFLQPLRLEDQTGPRRHIIAGFSLGGDTAVKLANKLVDAGEEVAGLLLVDPVAEPWWWLLGKSHKIDSRVNIVRAYGQNNDQPKHDPIYYGEHRLNPIIMENEYHGTIDDNHVEQYTADLLDFMSEDLNRLPRK